MLVEKGAIVDYDNNKSGTALQWAANFGHKDIVSYLIEKGVNVNYVDKNNDSPLIWAAWRGSIIVF